MCCGVVALRRQGQQLGEMLVPVLFFDDADPGCRMAEFGNSLFTPWDPTQSSPEVSAVLCIVMGSMKDLTTSGEVSDWALEWTFDSRGKGPPGNCNRMRHQCLYNSAVLLSLVLCTV